MINTVKDYEKLSEQYNKMLAERNSLIDDLSWYRAKVSRLERKNRDYKVANRNLADYGHEWKNEYVKLENKTKVCKSLLSEISQHVGNKPSSSTYKYFRAKLDSIGIKVGE